MRRRWRSPPFAYRFARQHARDPRFTFGTGKLGDLAAFASMTREGADKVRRVSGR